MRTSMTAVAAVLLAAAPIAALAQSAGPGTTMSATQAKPGAMTPPPAESAQMKSPPAMEHQAMAHQAMAHKTTMSRRQIEELQTALETSGAKIAADGIWGPKTTAALRDFQKQNGLKTTGQLDRETRAKLTLPHWG